MEIDPYGCQFNIRIIKNGAISIVIYIEKLYISLNRSWPTPIEAEIRLKRDVFGVLS